MGIATGARTWNYRFCITNDTTAKKYLLRCCYDRYTITYSKMIIYESLFFFKRSFSHVSRLLYGPLLIGSKTMQCVHCALMLPNGNWVYKVFTHKMYIELENTNNLTTIIVNVHVMKLITFSNIIIIWR